MIKIESFSPANGFRRSSWVFFDDHMVIKTKSLTLDYEDEVKYEKIKSIQSARMADFNWLWVSFITAALLGFAIMVFNHFKITSPILTVVEKIVAVFTLAMVIPAFRKHLYYSFLDADKKFFTTVRLGGKNKQKILEAIKLIKQRVEITSEAYFDDPLPATPPKFRFTEFDFPDYLNKSEVNVYDDKIIDMEKSLVEEVTTVIKFEELSGNTRFVRTGNDNWSKVASIWLFFMCITYTFTVVFFPTLFVGNDLYLNSYIGCIAILIVFFLLQYIKTEALIFYDKKDNGIFWTRVNPDNLEILEEIIELINTKLEPQNGPSQL